MLLLVWVDWGRWWRHVEVEYFKSSKVMFLTRKAAKFCSWLSTMIKKGWISSYDDTNTYHPNPPSPTRRQNMVSDRIFEDQRRMDGHSPAKRWEVMENLRPFGEVPTSFRSTAWDSPEWLHQRLECHFKKFWLQGIPHLRYTHMSKVHKRLYIKTHGTLLSISWLLPSWSRKQCARPRLFLATSLISCWQSPQVISKEDQL